MTSYTINSKFLAKNIENWKSYSKMKKKPRKSTIFFDNFLKYLLIKKVISVTIHVYNRKFEIYSKKFSKWNINKILTYILPHV